MKIKNWVWFLIILFVMFLVSNAAFFLMKEYGDEESKKNDIILAERIYDGIRSEIDGPILIARSMAKDSFLYDFLNDESSHSDELNNEQMKKFLEGIKDAADCNTIFVVSDKSKKYYTDKGLNKVINPDGDSHDVWYNVFKDKAEDYTVDVDRDEANNDKMTVFINYKVVDTDGTVLGVCGVGISMEKIQDIFKNYEDSYNIKVIFADQDGLVQADVNDINIETTYCDTADFSMAAEYKYDKNGFEGFTISRYVDELNWYLVVKETQKSYILDRLNYTFVLWSAVLFILIGLISVLLFRKGSMDQGAEYSTTDVLTGLPNRNYFKEVYGEHGIYNTTRYKSMVVWDVDSFKEANDSLDGNKVLTDIVEMAKQCFGEKGLLFRWGGDEFMGMLEWSVDFGTEICKEFCKMVEKDGRVTISIGITEVKLSDTIKKNYHRAVQGCYLVKEMGGNGVKRN